MRGQDLVHQVRQEDHDGVDDSHVGVNGTVATGGLGVVPVADVTKNRNYQVFRNPINYLPICIICSSVWSKARNYLQVCLENLPPWDTFYIYNNNLL